MIEECPTNRLIASGWTPWLIRMASAVRRRSWLCRHRHNHDYADVGIIVEEEALGEGRCSHGRPPQVGCEVRVAHRGPVAGGEHEGVWFLCRLGEKVGSVGEPAAGPLLEEGR